MTAKPSPLGALMVLAGIVLAIVLPLTTGASTAWGIALFMWGIVVSTYHEKQQLQAEVDRLKSRWN